MENRCSHVQQMNKRNVIIGAIRGYDFEVLRPFLMTLRRTGYSGDIVFFHSQIDAATLAKLSSGGVTLIPFTTTFPYSDEQYAAENKWNSQTRVRNLGLFCLRFLLAYCYLKRQGSRYQEVLLTDTRDVIFQKDPFDFVHRNALCCFMERAGAVITDSEMNTRWIEQGFGKDELERLANKPIICAGVTIGSVAQMLKYLEIFIRTIIDCNISAEIDGIDQGVHNYLIHEGLLPEVEIFSNTAGPVLTLGLEHTVVWRNGIILNANQGMPNIVHQYDRHWHVARKYYSTHFILRQYSASAREKLSLLLRSVREQISLFLRRHLPSLYRSIINARKLLLKRLRK